jgi:hypothetical protein
MKNTFKIDFENWTDLNTNDWNEIDFTDWSNIDLEDWKLSKLNWELKELNLFNKKKMRKNGKRAKLETIQ